MTALTERSTLVRPLGALERLFFRYSERYPSHFLLVAEFDMVLDAGQLRRALNVIQRRHPLLSVHVRDHSPVRLGFHRAHALAPIALQVLEDTDGDWQSVAAGELTRPFDRSTTAPLVRAALLARSTSSTLFLTFDHTVGDGLSSIIVLDDLVAALNGRALDPLPTPPSIEDLIDNSSDARAATSPANPDARMAVPSSRRPFDGTPPFLHAVTMTQADTTRLARRCRAESTTVHSAIVVAASRIRAQMHGEDFVRTLSPINVRAVTHAQPHCAVYVSATCTGLPPHDTAEFWDQARATTGDLDSARSPAGVVTASHAIRQAITVNATASSAEHVFGNVFAWEIMATNLGRQSLTHTGDIAPSAIWGPIVQSHTAGEYAVGILTHRDRLRMVCVSHLPVTDYLAAVLGTLETVATD
jgi:hypothetical protein